MNESFILGIPTTKAHRESHEMTWIEIIAPADADPRLAKIYQRSAGDGQVDRILLAHSLRPHTLEGHMALYRAVLHHPRNTLNRAFAEAIGVLVSRVNCCGYCVDHHLAGMRRALADPDRAEAWTRALEDGPRDEVFDTRQRAALAYAEQLALAPAEISESTISLLRKSGWNDGEILEINQITAYFCYANRTVLGLGVTTEGEELGEHPDQ
ncbi:MAG: peroxidase-related enzyme [Wenzhouxiangellaceae bacterium]|nr:peroxidase-related enzyme [Wenzhouxiangellaceae bacterium]